MTRSWRRRKISRGADDVAVRERHDAEGEAAKAIVTRRAETNVMGGSVRRSVALRDGLRMTGSPYSSSTPFCALNRSSTVGTRASAGRIRVRDRRTDFS